MHASTLSCTSTTDSLLQDLASRNTCGGRSTWPPSSLYVPILKKLFTPKLKMQFFLLPMARFRHLTYFGGGRRERSYSWTRAELTKPANVTGLPCWVGRGVYFGRKKTAPTSLEVLRIILSNQVIISGKIHWWVFPSVCFCHFKHHKPSAI